MSKENRSQIISTEAPAIFHVEASGLSNTIQCTHYRSDHEKRRIFMITNYIYHVTKPAWLTNGIGRLCLKHYPRPPADKPYLNHAPHNALRQANPGSQVYATFFFSDEQTAVNTAFVFLSGQHVVIRASVSDPVLTNLLYAEDDRDSPPGAQMRYGHDCCEPVCTPEGWEVHPSWGIPFERLEVKSSVESPWVSLMDYVKTLPHHSKPDPQQDKRDPEQDVREALKTYKNALVSTYYRNWWHRTLLWFRVSRARETESNLIIARARAEKACNQSEQHRKYVRVLAEQQPPDVPARDLLLDLI